MGYVTPATLRRGTPWKDPRDESGVTLVARDMEVWADACVTTSRSRLVDRLSVTLTRRGRGLARWRAAELSLHPGVVMIVPPNEVCVGTASGAEGWESICVLLDATVHASQHPRYAAALQLETPLLAIGGPLASALEEFAGGLDRGEHPPLSGRELFGLVAESCLAAEPSTPAPAEHVIVRRTRAHVRARIADPLSLDELAHVAGANKWSVLRAFVKHVGVSPAHYQRLLRVALARTVIADGRSVTEATFMAGFCDQSHLNRCFKRALGVTPGAYAQAVARERATIRPIAPDVVPRHHQRVDDALRWRGAHIGPSNGTLAVDPREPTPQLSVTRR